MNACLGKGQWVGPLGYKGINTYGFYNFKENAEEPPEMAASFYTCTWHGGPHSHHHACHHVWTAYYGNVRLIMEQGTDPR